MRIARRLLHALIIVLTLVVGTTAAGVIVTQTAWFRNWLRVYIEREANQYVNGQVTIGRLEGNALSGIELENIAVSMDGSAIVGAKGLGLNYSIFELISTGLSVKNVRLNQPVVYLRREGDTWSISRLIKKQAQEADREGPMKPIAIGDIGISDGSLVLDGPVGIAGVTVPKRFDHLDAKFNFKYEPVRYAIQIAHLSFRGSDPAIGLNAMSGTVSLRDDTVVLEKMALRTEETSLSIDGTVQHYLSAPVLKVQMSSDRTSIPEIARIVPALAGIPLQPAYELKLDGPLTHLGVDIRVRSSAGDVAGTVIADLVAPDQAVTGSLSIRHLDLSPILNDRADKSDLTADARVDLHAKDLGDINSLRGTIALESPRLVFAGYTAERVKADAQIEGRQIALTGRATAYGATADAAGRVTLPRGEGKGADALAYDLRGRAEQLDLRKLPRDLNVPPASTDVNATYHVIGAGPSSISADLRFEPSTLAGVRIADGSTAGATIEGENIAYRADAAVQGLDLERIGQEFEVPALATDQFKSAINGHFVANGSGTKAREINLTANGMLTDASIIGGTISALTFDAVLAGDTAHIKVNGGFSGFDPAVASGKTGVKGMVGGRLDVDATVAGLSNGVTTDNLKASGTINLDASTIGGLTIDNAAIDGDYENSVGQIRTFGMTGRDLVVQASGTLALDEAGSSNLTFHADTLSLEQIGKLVEQPLSGIAKVDGTITGNKSQLQVEGHVTGDGVKYGENGALTLASRYTVTIPELRVPDAQVSATTDGTFVTVAGQDINELHAKTDYVNQQLTFDATAKQPQRSLSAAGSMTFGPAEVHLQSLSLQTQGATWQLAPGAKPVIQYADESIAVNDLELVNGNQKIDADGTFGKSGQALTVTLANVDLASVNALLLRPPQFTGKLNASSTITGTKDAPQVKGDVQVSQGGFGAFKYDSLNATVEYAGKGVTLDAKLQENPTAWITAKGYVPTAALALSAASARPHRGAGAADDRIDLHIDSSPLDIGIIQGFTTALTKVTGTVQAKIDVTGAADDPHPIGAITVQHAAFTVEPTGVAYTGLDGRIDLESDRLHIGEITLLDNRQKPLTISGDLAIHELSVGTFNVTLKTDDFKVIDNKIGNLRITSNLRLTGELANPRIEGDLGVQTGSINLDPILAQTGASPYATEATDYTSSTGGRMKSATPSAFDALQVDVHLTVPNDLIIKGSNLQTADAPIGLGALNVTLGGNITVSKVPWDQIRLVGVVNTIRGTYAFQGRQFAILRDGTVRFVGSDQLNPNLDIRTQRVIQGVEANVNIRGTLEKPEIVMSSVPPLDQSDILSLIVFNQPINSLGEGQQISLAQRAEGIAAGAAAGELAKSIGSALNLNTFDIQMAPDSGATAEVTVGQQIGQKLFVKVQQDVGDQSSTNFIVEYELKDWLRLRSNVLQGSSTQQSPFRRAQDSGADLIFVAQQGASKSATNSLPGNPSGTVTMIGCLQRRDLIATSESTTTASSSAGSASQPGSGSDEGGFILTGATSQGRNSSPVESTFRLEGKTTDLSSNVGKRVEVTGTLDPAVSQDSTNGPTSVSSVQRLRVAAVRPVSGTCSIAGGH